MIKDFGIYIHIPFCRQKCFYCDFPSFAGKERMIGPYLEALEQEMGQVRQRPVGRVASWAFTMIL